MLNNGLVSSPKPLQDSGASLSTSRLPSNASQNSGVVPTGRVINLDLSTRYVIERNERSSLLSNGPILFDGSKGLSVYRLPGIPEKNPADVFKLGEINLAKERFVRVVVLKPASAVSEQSNVVPLPPSKSNSIETRNLEIGSSITLSPETFVFPQLGFSGELSLHLLPEERIKLAKEISVREKGGKLVLAEPMKIEASIEGVDSYGQFRFDKVPVIIPAGAEVREVEERGLQSGKLIAAAA